MDGCSRRSLHDRRNGPDGEVGVDTEDAVTMLFETDRGATGSVVISQASRGRKNRLWMELDGEASSYSFDQETPDRLEVGSLEGTLIVPKGAETTLDAAAVSPYLLVPAGHPQGYQDAFTLLMVELGEAVRGRPAAGMPTFVDGARAAAITAAAVASSESGNWAPVASTELQRIA